MTYGYVHKNIGKVNCKQEFCCWPHLVTDIYASNSLSCSGDLAAG